MCRVRQRQIRKGKAILNGLLIMHSKQLDGESFLTLIMEVEAIINSKPLPINSSCNANSDPPISTSDTLTMKSSVVFPLLSISKGQKFIARRCGGIFST